MEEIAHCISHGLVSPKDHVVYKLMLDFHEQLSQKRHALERIAPSQYKFYSKLTKSQFMKIMDKIPTI
jgi:hypothetical protein